LVLIPTCPRIVITVNSRKK